MTNQKFQAERARLPSVAALHQVLTMHEDGTLSWKWRPKSMFKSERSQKVWNTKYCNRPAFRTVGAKGYFCGRVFGRKQQAHNVVFKMHYGYEPELVDHIDGDRKNNRPGNLRPADHSSNMRNAKLRRDNKSGVPGVRWDKRAKKWEAKIGIGHGTRAKVLGRFKTFDEAASARHAAERELSYPVEHGKRWDTKPDAK